MNAKDVFPHVPRYVDENDCDNYYRHNFVGEADPKELSVALVAYFGSIFAIPRQALLAKVLPAEDPFASCVDS